MDISKEMLTFMVGVITAALSFLGFWLKERSSARLATKELEAKIAVDRADDVANLERSKIETIEKAMSTAAAQVERLLAPVMLHEREARIQLQTDLVLVRTQLAAVQRELAMTLKARCPRHDCPIYVPFQDNGGPI